MFILPFSLPLALLNTWTQLGESSVLTLRFGLGAFILVLGVLFYVPLQAKGKQITEQIIIGKSWNHGSLATWQLEHVMIHHLRLGFGLLFHLINPEARGGLGTGWPSTLRFWQRGRPFEKPLCVVCLWSSVCSDNSKTSITWIYFLIYPFI